MNKYLLLILAAGIFIVGCKHDDDDMHHDEEYNPTVEISSPTDGEMGTVGQEMSIEAEIEREDDKIIHNVTVTIEDADGNIVETLIDDEHVHSVGHYHIDEHFTPTTHGEYTLRVLTNDHDDTSKKVETTRSFTVIEATYDVIVDIQDPVENTTIAVNDDLAVKVVYTHELGGTVHHVKIEVQDDGGNVVATLMDHHAHVAGEYIFENATAYTADTAGTFKIVARTMNMDMSIMQMAEQTFTVQ